MNLASTNVRTGAAIVFALLLSVIGCTSPELPDLAVEDLKYQQLPSGARIVSGELLNPSDRVVPNAQLQLSLFDKDNIFVSSMFIVVKNIPPGDRVAFREPVDVKADVYAARVKSVLVL